MGPFVIISAAQVRWDMDLYPTKEAAEKELRSFFKGVSGVKFDRFTILPLSEWENSRWYRK